MTELRVLVCGDRDYTDTFPIYPVLDQFATSQTLHIIHGACRGVDTTAKNYANERKIGQTPFPADWNMGRRGGPIRNRQMIVEGKPDLVLAFHGDISSSTGTKNMIDQAKKAGLKVILFDTNGNIVT